MRYFLISDNPDTLTGMRLAGIEGVLCEDRAEAMQAIQTAVNDPEIGILLISDGLSAQCAERVTELKLHAERPLVVEIPSRGQPARSADALTQVIQDAIGIQL